MKGNTAYISLIRQLYKINVNFPVKMGVQNSQNLYNLLGHPMVNIPIVHVGGTNGKGSVCMKMYEALRMSKIKTGLFVSPHISSFRERIQVDGEIMTEDEVLNTLPYILQLCEKNGVPATFFELTTALAFHHFRNKGCDAVVLEVGLGGKHDATNVITPVLSIITSIQLDHTKILGSTLEEIAKEKAGIMKPGIDVLVGPHCPLSVLKEHATHAQAELHVVIAPASNSNEGSDIDLVNVAISKTGLALLQTKANLGVSGFDVFRRLTDSSIQSGTVVRPPCRFQVIKKQVEFPKLDELKSYLATMPTSAIVSRQQTGVCVDVILDIAHNLDAIEALVSKVKLMYRVNTIPIRIVVGFCADKDVALCLDRLLTLTGPESFHCVAAKHPRALSSDALQKSLLELVEQQNATQKNKQSFGTSANTALMPAYRSIRQAVDDAIASCAQAAATAVTLSSGNTSSDMKTQQRIAATDPVVDGIVLVCGTFFIMSEARASMGIVEPRDGDILHDLLTETGAEVGRDAQECFTPRSALS